MMYQLPIDMITSRISTKRATKSPFFHSAPSPYGFSTATVAAGAGGGTGSTATGAGAGAADEADALVAFVELALRRAADAARAARDAARE
jgi:hypothetical protein